MNRSDNNPKNYDTENTDYTARYLEALVREKSLALMISFNFSLWVKRNWRYLKTGQ